MTDDLLSMYERCKAIGMSADSLREGFWHEFAKLKKHASRLFSRDMKTTALVDAMDQLQQYYSRFVKPLYEDNSNVIRSEKQKVTAAMEELIENQFNVVYEKEATWDVAQCSISITKCFKSIATTTIIIMVRGNILINGWTKKLACVILLVRVRFPNRRSIGRNKTIAGRTRLPKKWFKVTRTQDYYTR